jgi:glycosyltransferase involved in cell wall biosynthesis
LVLSARGTAPVVVRLHSAAKQLYPWVSLSNLDARLSIALERRSILNADLVMSTRTNLEELARSLGPRLPPTRAIPLPVAEFPAAEATPSGPRVTFVGRLEARKGPDLLLSAVPGVLSAMPEARFTFIGADTGRAPGSYLALLRERAEAAGISHAVDFVGHRPRTEVLEALRDSSVCVFPSRWESFGYGPAEAAALGKAVVASQIPAFIDLFGETGAAVLVPVDDTSALTRGVLDLLQSPERARAIGEAARRRVAETCAPARVAAVTLEAYEEARSSSGSRGRRRRRAAVGPTVPASGTSIEQT